MRSFLFTLTTVLALLAGVAPSPASNAMPSASLEASPLLLPANRSIPDRMVDLLDSCGNDLARVIEVVFGDTGFWHRQKEIARSVAEHQTTLVPAGNGVGKSYSVARIILSWLVKHPNGIAVTTAPTYEQLNGVLWKEMRRSHRASALPIGGKFTAKPLKFTLSEEWFCLGLSGASVESMSGQHAKDLLFVADEASGVDEGKFEAGNSLNPSRKLFIGNPLRPHGKFFELCEQAQSGINRFLNLIRIPSTESPHAHLDRSPVGMADRTWLEASKAEYGEKSIWWMAHVLALFPTDTHESLLKSSWIDLAGRIIHKRSGHARLAIDLGAGNGGDRTVLLVRDDAGLLALEWSREMNFEAAATRAALLCQQFDIPPQRVSYDAAGLGVDFGNRLGVVGIIGARAYLGGASAKNAVNLRSAAAREMRRRFDPERMVQNAPGSQILVKQTPFAIRPDWLAEMRPELLALRVELDNVSRYKLEPKEKMTAALRRSPDIADVMLQSFAYY